MSAAVFDYMLVIGAVLLLGASQVLQKLAAQDLKARGSRLASPRLLAAVLTLACGTAVWLAALYRVDVSRAVPFLSLGQLLVMGAAHFYLREPISRAHWAGAVAIAAGVALVAAS